jgi:hypothetical protein
MRKIISFVLMFVVVCFANLASAIEEPILGVRALIASSPVAGALSLPSLFAYLKFFLFNSERRLT